MDDGRARILDVVHAGGLGDDARLLRADPELEPERGRADRRRLPGHVRAELGPAEYIHEVDRLLERRQGRPVALVGAERIDAQHAVADALEVARDAVARLRGARRRADDGDRLRVPQDLLGAPHYHRTVPEEELVARWQLTLGEQFQAGAGGRVYRVTRADGAPAVLKIGIPHREAEQEADALERWNGDGAIRLLARDDERNALLLELCEPGTPLSALGTKGAMDVLCDLLPRLWVGADGFHTLVDEIECWAELGELDGELLQLARDLASSQGELVLTHQDLHGDNVISAQREPWLVIDPKPLAAEREFQAAPILRSGELGHTKQEMLYRLDRLAELGLDRERMIGWTIVQTTAWSEGATLPSHGAVLEWLS